MIENKELTEIEIDYHGSISASEIVFGEEIREICEGNAERASNLQIRTHSRREFRNQMY